MVGGRGAIVPGRTEGQHRGIVDHRPASYRDVLRTRTTQRLWLATAVSVLGDFVGAGALLVLAYERSGQQALGPAALLAATAVGSLGVGVFGGPTLDRLSRREALTGAQALGAGAILLPVLVGGLPVILVAAVVLGAVRAAAASLRHGVLADSVSDPLRSGFLALGGATDQIGQVAGYVIGAAMAVHIGASAALQLDAASFALGALILWTAGLPDERRSAHSRGLADGWRVIFTHPHLRVIALLVFASTAVSALPEMLAASAVADTPNWLPAVLAAGPAGTAVGMLVAGRASGTQTFRGQLRHLTAFGAFAVLAALASGPLAYFLANLLIGAGAAWILGPQVTFVRLGPPRSMAQVTAAMVALTMAGEGLATVMFGLVADRRGVSDAYGAAGLVVIATAIVGWVIYRRRSVGGLDHLERTPAPDAA